MGKIQEVEEQRFKNYRWSAASYYDHPDGQDIFGKLSFTLKVSFIGGTLYGLLCAYTGNRLPVGDKARLIVVCSRAVPAMGIAAAFTITTYIATNLRKKDDPFNYVLGGLAAGAIFGAVTSPTYGTFSSLLFAGIGYAKKATKMEGKNIFLHHGKPQTFGTYFKRSTDFSLMPYIKGNWTK